MDLAVKGQLSCAEEEFVEELPQDIWALILQHVDYKQRLSSCALLCRKLARAAAAATQSLELEFSSPQQHDAFVAWTSSHGSTLTQLKLSSDSPIRQLPCPHLLELQLDECSGQLCASSDHVGLLHSCTALTKLILERPTVLDGETDVPDGAAPAAMAQLQSLRLFACRAYEGTAQALEQRLFPHLTSLTRLDVGGSESELLSCFLDHISTMTSLQQLIFATPGEACAATVPAHNTTR
jgi:hypothetical protein